MKKLTLALWALVVALAPLAAGQGGDCNEWDGLSHKMHWPQYPDPNDLWSMAVSLGRVVLADDFVCTATGPIRDIHIWGSFQNGHVPEGGADGLTFELTIYADVPATEDHWSQPGRRLWRRVFQPGQYTCIQSDWDVAGWYEPAGGDVYMPATDSGDLFRYDFCIEEEPFIQEEGEVYWLAVKDIPPDPRMYWFGWIATDRRWGWNDRAVYLQNQDDGWIEMDYPQGHEYADWPLDLAFAIGNGETSPTRDLGDAPDSSNSFPGVTMLAYPSGETAHFPTVYHAGSPPYGPMHLRPRDRFYLGDAVSLENEADIGWDEDDSDVFSPDFHHNNLLVWFWGNQDFYDDGLNLPVSFPLCERTRFDYRVTVADPAARSAYVNVWCDWNRDGDWNDTLTCLNGDVVSEWAVQNDTPAFAGAGRYVFTSSPFRCWHPEGRELDPIWVRITIAEQEWTPQVKAGAGPVGGYKYGETEDYQIWPAPVPVRYDWADAPDDAAAPGYPTLKDHNGARHVIAGPWLGDEKDKPDSEPDGQPDASARGDDNNGDDDEDGVSIPPMTPGLSASATVRVGGSGGVVQLWIDFNGDKTWQTGEKVFDDFQPEGVYVISFGVPTTAVYGKTFARARISTGGGLAPEGPAGDGEVEDHEVEIVSPPPTILPGAVTQCPAVATTCPAVLTECPPIETQCPPMETKCPPAQTYCPAEQTKCPPVATHCPAEQTQCPPGQTYCPAEDTKCPPTSPTKCPESLTKCPPTATQCQSVATECPAVQTYCPAEDTKCPPTSPTKCPVEETKCPPVNTRCPATETQCPLIVTKCRVVDTQCPAKATRCPKAMTKCPTCGLGSLRSDAEEAAVFGVPCPIAETLCPTIGEYLAIAETRQ